jgi:hypothetical protein
MAKSNLHPITLLVLGVVLLLLPSTGNPEDPFEDFLEIKAFRCQWDKIAAVRIDGDKVRFDITSWTPDPKNAVNYFLDIDLVDKRTATFIGNLGSTVVRAFATAMGMFFVETSDMGAVHLTTIYPYKVGSTGQYLGTLSRNWEMVVPLPSLTYGLCQPWE